MERKRGEIRGWRACRINDAAGKRDAGRDAHDTCSGPLYLFGTSNYTTSGGRLGLRAISQSRDLYRDGHLHWEMTAPHVVNRFLYD